MAKKPKAPTPPNPYFALGASAWAEVFGKMLENGAFTTLRLVSQATSPRQSAEAFVEANRIAMEAALSVAECQCETLRETWQRIFSLGEELVADGDAAAALAKHYEMVRWGAEKFLADGRQLAGILGRLNEQSAAAARERLATMLEEIEELSLNWNQ